MSARPLAWRDPISSRSRALLHRKRLGSRVWHDRDYRLAEGIRLGCWLWVLHLNGGSPTCEKRGQLVIASLNTLVIRDDQAVFQYHTISKHVKYTVVCFVIETRHLRLDSSSEVLGSAVGEAWCDEWLGSLLRCCSDASL